MLKKSHHSKSKNLKNVSKVSYSSFEKGLMGAPKAKSENTKTNKLNNSNNQKDDFLNLTINVKVPVGGSDKGHLLDSFLHNISSLNLDNVSINNSLLNSSRTSHSTNINMPAPIKVENFDDFDDNLAQEPYIDKVKHQFGIDIENQSIKNINREDDHDFLSVISEIGSTTVNCSQKIENCTEKFMKKISFDRVEKLQKENIDRKHQEVLNKDNEMCCDVKIDVSETQITVNNNPINKGGDQKIILHESFSIKNEFRVPQIIENITISQNVTPSAIKLLNSNDLDVTEVSGVENNHLQIKSENESSEEKKRASNNLNTSEIGSIKSEIDSCSGDNTTTKNMRNEINKQNKRLSISERREIKKQHKHREEMAANDSVGFINSNDLMTTNEIIDIVMDMYEENSDVQIDKSKQTDMTDSFSDNDNKKLGKKDILTDSSEDSGGVNKFESKMAKRKVVLTKKKVVSNVLESSDEEEPKMSKKKKKPLPKKVKQEQKDNLVCNDVVKASELINVDNIKVEKSKNSNKETIKFDDKTDSSSDNEIIIKKSFSPKILSLCNKKQKYLLTSSSSDTEKVVYPQQQQQNVSDYDSDEELLMLRKALYKKIDDARSVAKAKNVSKISELKKNDFNENKKLGGDKKVVDSKREMLLIQNIESFKPSKIISDDEKNENEEEMNTQDVLDMVMDVYNDHYKNGNDTVKDEVVKKNKNDLGKSIQNISNLEVKTSLKKDYCKTAKSDLKYTSYDFDMNSDNDTQKTSQIVKDSDDLMENVKKKSNLEFKNKMSNSKKTDFVDFEINKVDSKKTSKIVGDSDALKKNVEGNSTKTAKMSDNDVKNNSFEKRVEETINVVVKKSNNKDFEIDNKVDLKKTSKIVGDFDVLKKNVEGNSNKTTKMNDNDVKNNSFEKRVEETINVVVKKSNNKDFEINNKVDSKKTSKIVVDSDVLKKNVEGNSNKTTKLNDKDVKNNSFEERVEETINDVVKKSNNKDFEAFEVYKEILQCGEDIKCGKENIKKKSNADLENAKGSKKISKKRNGKSKSNENDQNINKNKSFERRIDETIDEVIKNSKNDYDSQKINENESIKTLKPQESVEIENNLDTILTSTPKLTRKHQNEILTQEILDIINNVEETRKNKLMQRFMKGETSKSIGNHDDLKGDVKKNATKIYEKRNSIETFLTSTPKSNQNELILSKNQEKEGLNEILTKEIIENDESKKDKINKKSKKCEVTKSDENCGGVTKKGVKITRIDEKGTNLDTDLMATRKSNQDELILSKNQGKKGSNEISTQEIIDVIESVDESKKDKTNKTSKKGEVAKFNENCDDLKGGGKKKEVKTTRIDEKGTNLDIDLMATQKNNQDELILPKNQGEKGSNEISTQEIIDVIESVDESKKDKTNKRSKKGEVAKSNENCDDLKGGGKKKGAKAAKNDEKENDLDTVLMSTTKSNQDELILSKNQGEKGSKEISTQEIIDVIESVDKSKKEKRIKRCKIDEVAKSVENCDNLKEGGKKKGLKATKIDEKGNNLDVLMSTSKSNQDELISPKDEGDKSCNEISTQEIIDVIESADESKKNKRIKGSVKKKGLKAAKIDEKENNLDTFLTSTPKSSQDELISPKDQGEKSCNEISTQEIIDVIESVDESKKDKRIKGGVKKKGIKAAKIDEKENNLDTFLSNQHELISPKNPEDKVSYEKDETSKSVGNCDDLEKSIKKKDISTPITPKLTSESDKITSSSSMNQEPNNKDHESNQDLKNEDVVELEKKLQSKENVQIGNELERKVVPNRRSPRIKQPTIIKKLSLKKLKSSDDVEKDGKENLSQQDEIRCESVNIANVKNINPDLIGQTEAIKKNNVHVSPRKSPRLKSKTSLDKSENINVENDESSLIKSEKEELNKSLDDENVLKKRKKPSSPKKDVKKIKINLDFLTPRDKSKKNDKENSILNYLTNSKNSDDLNRESKPENDSNKSKETISFPEITSQEIFDQENEVCITKHKRKNMIEDAIIAKQAEILNDAITNQLEANNSDINEDVVTNTSISLLIPETTVSEYIGNEFGESLFVNCGEEISEVNETNELESDETIKRKSYESDVSKKFKSSPKQTVIKKKSKKLPSNRNIFEDSVDESSSNESVADEKMIRLIEKAVERVLERKFGKRKKKQLNNSRDSKRFKKDSFSSNESKCRSEKRKLTPGPQKKIKKDNKKKYLIIKNTDSNDSTSENGDTSDQDFGEKRISNLNSNISNLSSNSSNGCSSKQSSLDIRTSLVMKCLDTIHTTKTNRRKIIEESSSSNNSDIEPDEVSNEFIDAISEAQFHMNTSSSRYDTIRGLQIKIDFEVPELHKVTTRISRGLITKHQQDVLNEKNIEILKDHYSSKEDFLIYTNFSRFCEVHNLENNPSPFLKLSSNKRSLLTPTQKVKFLQFIGKGLDQRPLCSIYLRFKNLMAKRKMGKFTQEEDAVVLNCANKLNKTKLAALEYILRRPKASILKRYEELTSNNVDMM